MPTYHDFSQQQLRALAQAVGQAHAADRYVSLQGALLEPWARREIPATPAYPSMIGDDHSPYEYSVAYSPGQAELRLLFEAQAERPSFWANHVEALRVNERLESAFGVSFERYRAISDLFRCTSGEASAFSVWHAVIFNPNGAPDFKVYLNPQLMGKEAAPEVIAELLARCGLADAQQTLAKLCARGELDELKYASIDLSADAKARVKIYACHHQASPEELERAFEVAPSHRAGDVLEFCARMAPQTRRFDRKSVSSCVAFTSGSATPRTATLHLPIAHYAHTDAEASQRIDTFMQEAQMDQLMHRRVLAAIARRPLAETSGVQSYASFRRQGGALRLTVYLSPELFRQSRSGDWLHEAAG